MFYCFCYYSCPNFPPLTPSTQPAPHSHSQSPHCCPCPWVIHRCSLTCPSTFFQLVPTSSLSSYSCQSVPWFHASGSILLISLFCSLDSTCKWDHMVFVFHWLAHLFFSCLFKKHNFIECLLYVEHYSRYKIDALEELAF